MASFAWTLAAAVSLNSGLGGIGQREWLVTLDIGREQNTWMPPQWCARGTRLSLPVRIRFEEPGRAICDAVGPYFPDSTFSEGSAVMQGSWPEQTLRFDLLCVDGYRRGDNFLPANTRIFFACPFLGGQPSKKPGLLSVKQRRMVVRLERRLIGTFRMSPATGEEQLPPTRVYQDDSWVC